MCDETIKADIELIKRKSAARLADALKSAPEAAEQFAARHFIRYTFAVAEYHAKTHAYMYPAAVPTLAPMSMPGPFLAPITPNLELDFA